MSSKSVPECDIRVVGPDRALLRINKTVSVETALDIARVVSADMVAIKAAAVAAT